MGIPVHRIFSSTTVLQFLLQSFWIQHRGPMLMDYPASCKSFELDGVAHRVMYW